MSINNVTRLSRVIDSINNPNLQVGTILQEVPADLGRAYEGYKRGGILEGTEKFRTEIMSAVVWLFGMPLFNKMGNVLCEKVLSPSIPMNIDYSNAKDGRDAIRDSVNYLVNGVNDKALDVSELAKYKDKFRGYNPDKLIKRIKGAKQISSIAALVLNCALMGIVLPKINQKITSKKLNEMNNNSTTLDIMSIDEYQQSVRRDKKQNKKFDNSFLGLGDFITYGVNNSNRFRLISTDVPMVIGRSITARNKFEALELAVMDLSSTYFYNFASEHLQKILGKVFKTPKLNPKLAEYISNIDLDKLKQATSNIKDGKNTTLEELFGDKKIATDIYKIATYDKYGKINRFVKDSTLHDIDTSVSKFISHINKNDLITSSKDNTQIKQAIKKVNIKNAGFVGAGLLFSIYGLSRFVPKLGFFITQRITGKNEFTGIADYSDIEKDKKKQM